MRIGWSGSPILGGLSDLTLHLYLYVNQKVFNILSLLSMSNIVLKFLVNEMEAGNFTGYLTEKFPVYEIETGNSVNR